MLDFSNLSCYCLMNSHLFPIGLPDMSFMSPGGGGGKGMGDMGGYGGGGGGDSLDGYMDMPPQRMGSSLDLSRGDFG